MNLVKAAELLKNAPENTLKQYLANPNGEFPEYLVASEIARRDDMRKRYAAEMGGQPPKTSIIEELLQRDNASQRAPQQMPPQMPPQMPQEVPPEAMGLGAVPPPPDMQLSPAPIADAAQQPQQFASGGAVAFAGGGDVLDAFNEYMRPSVHSGNDNYRAGIAPSFPVGEGSIDLNANVIGSPGYSGYQGRIGGSYPIGDGRLSAGISGIADKARQSISGYDVGYSDGANRLSANISPTEMGNAYGINYNRQLDRESAINAGLMRDPMGQMSGNLMYTKRFAAGDLVQYRPDLSAFEVDTKLMQPQGITEVKELADYQKQMSDLVGPSAAEGYQDILSKQRGEIEGRKKNYLSDFLIRSGLGMAMSKENPLQAAAQGLAGGFENYQKAKEQDAAAERSLVDSEFKFKQAQRAEGMGLLGLSRQAMSDAMNDRRAGQEAARSSQALLIQAATGKNNAINQAAQLGVSERELALRAREIAAAAQRHKETMAMEEKRIRSQVERDNAITPTVRTQAANVVSDAITRYRKQLEDAITPPEWYTNAQTKIESLANNPLAQQVEMQRLENRIRINSGLSTDILKIAGFN
jgi:hypothetical protein